NELPEEFQYDPVSKTYGDPSRRPEIKSSTIEYIAPAEYMLRPPQPAVYLFLLDVSRVAIECGYLATFVAVLKDELRNLPGDARTQIGFVAYDSQLHFFKFGDEDERAREMLVLDVDDVFLPSPDNLLVNLGDKADAIADLLDQLPARYANTHDTNCALGAALQAAHKMMSATGGRVTVFQCALPNVGPGALTPREDPNRRASGDVQHLKPANDFYKRLALDCSGQQIAVDLFVANSQYVDLATVAGVSKFSGGCVHHFPLFKAGRPVLSERFERTFRRYLTRKIGFEAVMRIRCSRGLSIHTFHGN
nr:Sec24AB ortholog [Cucujiformia]